LAIDDLQWCDPARSVVVRDADRPARADNGGVVSHTAHIEIDVRIDSDEIIGQASAGPRGHQ
jgi:hypothetical protein